MQIQSAGAPPIVVEHTIVQGGFVGAGNRYIEQLIENIYVCGIFINQDFENSAVLFKYLSENSQFWCLLNRSAEACKHPLNLCKAAKFRFLKTLQQVVRESIAEIKQAYPQGHYCVQIRAGVRDNTNPIYVALHRLGYSDENIDRFLGEKYILNFKKLDSMTLR